MKEKDWLEIIQKRDEQIMEMREKLQEQAQQLDDLYSLNIADNDARMTISHEGLLEALTVAIEQAKSILNAVNYGGTFCTELEGHIEYLEQLHQNIKDDACNNYPPVVRKRFKNDPSLL